MPNWLLGMDVVQARPCGLCEIIHDFEGQNRAYTYIYRLFDWTSFDTTSEIKAKKFLPQSLVALK